MSSSEEFWAGVDRSGGDDSCWPWTGTTFWDGYGSAQVKGKQHRAHRVAYALAIGSIPPGLLVCHACDNRICCNPQHLWVGTQQQNLDDMRRKGRSLTGDRHPSRTHPESVQRGEMHWTHREPERPARGEQHGMAKLTAENVNQIRSRVAAGETQVRLADEYGVTFQMISRIARREAWKHLENQVEVNRARPQTEPVEL